VDHLSIIGQVITVEDWSEIRVLARREGLSQREIACRLGISRVTVKRALDSQGPPGYGRGPRSSGFDVFEAQVTALLRDHPRMPVTVIAQRVRWPGSITNLRRHVRVLRPLLAPVDPADRLEYVAGDQCQCDLWFPPVKIPLGDGVFGTPPVLVMVASFSRFITARMLPSRTTTDLLAGTWGLLQDVGGVPRRLLWDNEAGIGRRNKLTKPAAFFAGSLATRFVQLKPRDPESKGIVERANRYLETSFLPGRVFVSPQDFNTQLQHWLVTVANERTPRRTGTKASDALTTDRGAMLALPPLEPLVSLINSVRLPRDYYVRAGSNDYSVDPRFIGRIVAVHMNLTHVWVSLDGVEITRHERVWGKARTVTDRDHVATAARLRAIFQAPRSVATDAEMVRDLADYDTAFGVNFDPKATFTGEGIAS